MNKVLKRLNESVINEGSWGTHPLQSDGTLDFTGDLFGHGILTYNDSNELDKAQKDIQEEKLKQKSKQPKMLEKEEDDYEL